MATDAHRVIDGFNGPLSPASKLCENHILSKHAVGSDSELSFLQVWAFSGQHKCVRPQQLRRAQCVVAACPAQSIQISLSQATPKSERPGALAYALPYEGTHIVVFYDRIAENREKSRIGTVLAHVLVHEITHILEGVSRHSNSSVMKAHWDEQDFCQNGVEALEVRGRGYGPDQHRPGCTRRRATVAMNSVNAQVAAQ